MKHQIKEWLIHAKTKVESAAMKFTAGLATAAVAMGVPVNAYADPSTTTFSNASVNDGNTIIGNIITVVGSILTWGGALVLIGAVVAYLLAFRNEDVEGKHKAGLAFAIGIAMVSFPAILKTVGITGK